MTVEYAKTHGCWRGIIIRARKIWPKSSVRFFVAVASAYGIALPDLLGCREFVFCPMKQIKVQPVYRDVRRRHRHTMHEMMKIIGYKTAAMLARYAIHVPMTWRW